MARPVPRTEREDTRDLCLGADASDPTNGPRTEPPARVSVQAVGADGTPLYRGRVPDVVVDSAIPLNAAAAAAAAPTPAAARGPSQLVFEVPPGTMQLRLQVENQRATVIDTNMHEDKVPDLTAPQVQLSTPRCCARGP